MDVQELEIEEASLIRKAKQGDELAFTRLVRKYEDMVFRFSLTVCRDKVKAEEAFHETFINVFKKLKQFDGKSKFSTWLYRIVANNCLMKRRRRKIDLASVPLDMPEGFMEDPLRDASGQVIQTVPSWKETPLDGVVNEELKHLLDEAIGKLPPDYRAVFLLRDIEEQSAEETAKALSLTVPAVKSRLHRARAFLREQLHPYMKA